jgi:CheY-like chemotaxis protein/DNA-binding CsgD family transcriptional regulator
MADAGVPIVVLIDDQPEEEKIVQLALSRLAQPTRLITATGVAAGLQQLAAHAGQVRVVLLDVHMRRGDVDGRWAVTEIHRLAPQAHLIPYTSDREAGEQLRELGCCPPLIKPVSPPVLRQTLDGALQHSARQRPVSRLYRFLKEQAPQVLRQAEEQRAPLRVLIVAQSAMQRHGLRALLSEGGAEVVPSEDPRSSIHHRRVDVLLGSLECWEQAAEFSRTYSLPLLLYATEAAELSAIPPALNIIVEPVGTAALVGALEQVASGTPYGLPAQVRAMSTTQRRLLQLLAADTPTAAIIEQLDVTPDYLRQLRARLYKQLGLPDLAALQDWAKTVFPAEQSP